MSIKYVLATFGTSVVAVGALIGGVPTATAATAPVSEPRVVAHLDLATGQQPENITLLPHHWVAVTFPLARQIAAIGPDGTVKVLATLPAPPPGSTTPVFGAPFVGGIVRAHDGTLYVTYATGTSDLTGIWRLRPGGTPHRIAPLPATGFPNGLALDRSTGALYTTDSVLGTIWRVPTTGGTPTAWSTDPALARVSFGGANGVKIHHGAVWATNLDQGTVLRIPIHHDQTAGRARVVATGLTFIDDIAFTGPGDTLLAALNKTNEVDLVKPDGTHTTVLDAADGLQNPTSIAVRGDQILVPNAAYFTMKDPSLIAARLTR